MIRSLRWRLQLWHALLLTTVLIIFGGVVYALQWQTRLQQADAELDRVASVLASRLRGLFPVPRMPPSGPWPPRTPGRGENDRQADAADALTPVNVPPRGRDNRGSQRNGRDGSRDGNREPSRSRDASADSKDEGRGTAADRSRDGSRSQSGRDQASRDQSGRNNPWYDPPPGLGLPEEFKKHFFEGDEQNSFYFIIWDRNGNLLEKSKSAGDIAFPDLHTPSDGLPFRISRTRELWREVVHVSRFDINVLVGQSLQPELTGLHRSAVRLVLTGLGVLAIGLAGGWWFSSRAIRPIAEMSVAAESISVKNLSTRINVQSTATELEQLASVLNSTFDRLQSAFERQAQFTADASHELRTPISVILSHAELALSRPRSGEEYQRALQACRRASLRMKSLIDSLLLLARFDSGASQTELQPIVLDQLVHDAVELVQPLAEERHIELHCQAESITVNGDQERLFQVVTNLLTNSIRYNQPEGSVDVEVVVDKGEAVIRVADTGVGIPAEDLPHIFDRFYRVDKARTHAEGGCGLGLAICQSIVDSLHGTIRATSEPGVGTTIEVRLPLISKVGGSVRKESEVASESASATVG